MLHSSIEGFMQQLKTLPPVGTSPERGKFITAHMSHAPFVQAIKDHPQGAMIHTKLMGFLNSPANAGVVPGKSKVMVKSEKNEEATERKVEMPKWKDKQIVDPDHANDLEQRAAIHEFEGKLPKEAAEKKAHDEYKHEQHLKAAATHFAGMKAAKATGDHDEAKKHHAMYTMHLQQLGHDSMGALPKEVEHHMGEVKNEPFYRFQPHKADGFLFDGGTDKKKAAKKT